MTSTSCPQALSDTGVAWEQTPCPLCESSDEELLHRVYVDSEQLECCLVRCQACGMIYMNPRPDPASIGRFYPEEYEPYQAPKSKPNGWWRATRGRLERMVRAYYLGDPPPLQSWHEKLAATLAAPWLRPRQDSFAAIPYQGDGRLLDFGCGSGWYAERMRQRGWNVTGMDFSQTAALRVQQRFGIPVLVGSLPHPHVAPRSYDVITMGCVLEHVHEPRRVIHAAARALRTGGKLAIVVPNIASWGFRFFGSDWWPLEPPRHLLHFTPATLRRLVEECGLGVLEVRQLARAGWMRRSLQNASRRQNLAPVARLLTICRKLRVLPSLLTRWSVWTGQADCILLVATKRDTLAGSS